MVIAALEAVWAAAEIDAAYVSILRATVEPQLPHESQAESATTSLADLVRLCCLAHGGNRRSCEQAALAWDVLYTALYLLDSVEDEDLRAGPWSRWGAGPATNIATGLLATMGALLSKLEATGVCHEIAQTVRADFFRALLGMTAGQHQDLTLTEPSLEQCWQIAGTKSGYMFGLACRVGTLLAGAGQHQAARCGEFGQVLGTLIQAGDDLDDLWPEPGKASDLRSGDRWTLPIAYAMTVLPFAEQEQLRDLLRAAPTDLAAEAEARSRILAAGAALYLATEARRLYWRARTLLVESVPESSARDGLLRLLDTYTPLKDR